MTGKALNAILMDVASETLESLAFMFSTPESTDFDVPEADDNLIVSVEFDGPFSGRLVVTAAAETLPELATSMLGIEAEDVSVHQKEDALKETINVVCGNLLPFVAGKEAVFNIFQPVIISRIELEAMIRIREPIAKAMLGLDAGSWMFWFFQTNAG